MLLAVATWWRRCNEYQPVGVEQGGASRARRACCVRAGVGQRCTKLDAEPTLVLWTDFYIELQYSRTGTTSAGNLTSAAAALEALAWLALANGLRYFDRMCGLIRAPGNS